MDDRGKESEKEMSEIREILQRLCWNYTYIEGDRKIDQALTEIKTLIEGCVPEKKTIGFHFDHRHNTPCADCNSESYNQAIDTMKSNLEKLFEEKPNGK